MNPNPDRMHAPDWYRVAALRPRLAVGVQSTRQMVRGQAWHVLSDPLAGHRLRLDERAWRLLAACDGRHTLDALWRTELERHGDDAPTQAEVMQALAQAHEANLLTSDAAPDAAALLRARRRRRAGQRSQWINPLSFGATLGRPDDLLERMLPFVRHAVSGRAFLVGALIALGGVLLALAQGEALMRDTLRLQASTTSVLWAWLAWPLLKALHEAAHGLALKARGGEVPACGLTLTWLLPMPWVDASSASALPRSLDRAAVSAAGMLVEAVAAALAIGLWTLLEPGHARDAALVVATMAGASSLLVNGNPLMRFDGYHLMTDLLQLPNLASRSRRWWVERLQPMVGLPVRERLATAPGETGWLVLYAPLSWAWTVAVVAGLSLWAASLHPTLGLAALAAALYATVGRPAWNVVRVLGTATTQPLRTGAVLTGLASLAAAVLLLWPVPRSTQAPAIVWLPDEAQLRTAGEARLERLWVAEGDRVEAGQRIATLASEPLGADLARARAELMAARVQRARQFALDAAAAAAAAADIERLVGRVSELERQSQALELRAIHAGRIALGRSEEDLGRWLPHGHVVARVLGEAPVVVRALVSQDDIDTVRSHPASTAHVRLAGRMFEPALPATVIAAQPLASTTLPGAALGEPAGGPLPLAAPDSPAAQGAEPGTVGAQSRFAFELRLAEADARAARARVGERAMVTFEHGRTSLAAWAGEAWRRAFLRHFTA